MKHTPGPWKLDETWPHHVIAGDRSNFRHSVASANREHVNVEANARLIRAAPALLAALKDLAASTRAMTPRAGRKLAQARAAIALAELDG